MAYFRFKAEYPCGFKGGYTIISIFGRLDTSTLDVDCPLHGKGCKKEEETK